MSAIAHLHQGARCTNDSARAGDNDAASTRSRRPRQKTTTDGKGTARPHSTNIPRHLGSRVGNKRRVCFRTMSGICGRAMKATRPGETQRHGTLWTIKQWERIAHYMLHVRCAAFFDTLAREFLMLTHGTTRGHLACIAATGATRDEEQEEQCSEPSGGSVGARQSLTERQLRNSVKEGTERLRSSTECGEATR